MARRPKKGLDYFPMDVDIFNDTKMLLLRSEFGTRGEAIYLRLLCRIYKEGYCTVWSADDATLMSVALGDGISPNTVNQVIQGCLRRSLFDKRVYEAFNILTGKGIQERYIFICNQLRRKATITADLDCCGFTEKQQAEIISSEETPITTQQTPQRKRNENKQNEMKEKCVHNTQWVQQTALAYGTHTHTLINFCNSWIEKAEAKQKFDNYGLNALIGFMLDDFDKEKSCAKKENNGTPKTGRIATNELEAFIQGG
ncbi:MAG: DUF4373 domain-containing protein [Chitinophagales bacterium]